MIHVLKTGYLNAKNNKFPEMLPMEEKVLKITDDITTSLVLEINMGTSNKGYRNYRDTEFKAKLVMLNLSSTS
jgi:hypothetical protein